MLTYYYYLYLANLCYSIIISVSSTNTNSAVQKLDSLVYSQTSQQVSNSQIRLLKGTFCPYNLYKKFISKTTFFIPRYYSFFYAKIFFIYCSFNSQIHLYV